MRGRVVPRSSHSIQQELCYIQGAAGAQMAASLMKPFIHAGDCVGTVYGGHHEVPEGRDVHIHSHRHILGLGALPPDVADRLARGQLNRLCN
jgi:hypothetical protein